MQARAAHEPRLRRAPLLVAVAAVVLAACSTTPASTPRPHGSPVASPPSTSTTSTSTTSTSTTSTSTTSTTSTTTPPPPPALLVIGDFGNGRSAESAVAAAMETYAASHPVAAVLTAGDNLYSNDAAADWSRPFGWVAKAGIPVWVTWGNHDVASSTRRSVVNRTFGNPPDWGAHSWAGGTVIILDSNRVGDAAQLAWLKAALAVVTPPVIVAFHYPALSCSYHGDSGPVDRTWMPVLEGAGVALVVSGHDHNYQRFSHGGVTYVVTGGGGEGIYALKSCPSGHPPRLAGAAVHEFLAVTPTPGGLAASVVGVDGKVLDHFTVGAAG